MEIRFNNIQKKMGSDIALSGINLMIPDTGIIGLLGDYGSGKSTVLSLIAGYLKPNSGEIFVNQQKANFREVRDAVKFGIGSIDPNLNLYNKFTIRQNLALDPNYSAKRIVEIEKEFSELCNQLKLQFEFDDLLGKYLDEEKIIFEIIRLYLFGYKVILLDEPFKYFGDQQKKKLVGVFELIKNQNVQIIFSTQFLDEICMVCDDCFVLQKGNFLGHYKKPFDQVEAIYDDMKNLPELKISEFSDTDLLSLVDFQVTSEDENVNYNLRSGEIVGVYSNITGTAENLLMCCAGLQKAFSGEIILNGFDLYGCSLQEFIDDGVVYIPADRLWGSLIPEMALYEHFGLMGDFVKKTYSPQQVKENSEKRLANIGLHHNINDKVKNLSRTNQVKFLFGLLPSALSLLICILPTAGLDWETKQWVWQQLISRAKSGIGVLIFSSDLEEIQQYTHNVWLNLDGIWQEPIKSTQLLTTLDRPASHPITTADEETHAI